MVGIVAFQLIASRRRTNTSYLLAIIATANALAPNRRRDISCGNADLSSLDYETNIPTKNMLSLWVKIGLKVLDIFFFLQKKVSGKQ